MQFLVYETTFSVVFTNKYNPARKTNKNYFLIFCVDLSRYYYKMSITSTIAVLTFINFLEIFTCVREGVWGITA